MAKRLAPFGKRGAGLGGKLSTRPERWAGLGIRRLAYRPEVTLGTLPDLLQPLIALAPIALAIWRAFTRWRRRRRYVAALRKIRQDGARFTLGPCMTASLSSHDVRTHACAFCNRPVSRRDGFLELYREREDGTLCYPSTAGRPLAVLAHRDCGPDNGYALALNRITPASLAGRHGLIAHVEAKAWSAPVFVEALRLAALVR